MKLDNHTAIYAGTFDPLTCGHFDIVRRAALIFDKLIVAIAESRSKHTFFSLDERVLMATKVLAPFKNVEVCGFNGLLMEFVHECGAKVVLRGLRAASDFEYEFQMAGMNRNIHPEVETMFLTPSAEHMFISATMVREVAMFGGDVSKFVPEIVNHHMQQKVAQLELAPQ